VARAAGEDAFPVIAAGTPLLSTPGIAGIGAGFGGGTQRISCGQFGATDTGPFTLEVLCAITAAPSLAGFCSISPDSGTGGGRGLLAYTGTRNIYFWGNSADVSSGVDWRVDGSLQHVFCVSMGSGQPMYFYRDGSLIATKTTPTLIATSAASTWSIGDTNRGWGSSPTGQIFKVARYGRALTAAEVAEITGSPWGFAEPQRIFVPVAASGGGSSTIGGAVAAGSSTTALSTPAGTQVQTSAIAAATSSATGSTPSATQAQQAAISGGTSSTSGSSPAATQTQAGAMAGGTSSTTISTVAATQTQQAAIAPGVSATSGSEPAGGVAGAPLVAAGISATALSTVAGTQIQRGTVSGGVSSTSGSSPAATQQQAGAVAACGSATAGTSIAATQAQAGAIASGSSTTQLSTVAGSMAGGPAIAPGLSSTLLSSVAGTQLQLGIVAPGLSSTLLQSIGLLTAGRRRALGVPVTRRALGVPVIRRASDMATVTKAAVLDVEEDDTLVFDFSKHTAALGSPLQSAEVEVDVRDGVDFDGAELLDGAHQVSGDTVLVPVGGAGVAVDCFVRCVGTLQNGKRVPIVMQLPVRRQ